LLSGFAGWAELREESEDETLQGLLNSKWVQNLLQLIDEDSDEDEEDGEEEDEEDDEDAE
jgi:hypothetical protein